MNIVIKLLSPLFVSKSTAQTLPTPRNDDSAPRAIVAQAIQPGQAGRVRFRASWWYARCASDVMLPPNSVVYVVGRQNITLLVEPLPGH